MNKKVFILLPDGVGLKNFAFTDFYKIGKENNFDITYWNNTVFDLETMDYKEIKIKNAKLHFLTDFLKNTRKHIEINRFEKQFNDSTYQSYLFPFSNSNLKSKLKNFYTKWLIKKYSKNKQYEILRKKIISNERKTAYFSECLETLKNEKPAFIFCTNQRSSQAIAPIEAAKSLGIKTAAFIFSWDNLPKATMVVETDYYFVWSVHMKNELLKYYPYIKVDKVIIAGTPQFENHFNSDLIESRESFFEKYQLNKSKKYICFSGDDQTTSPNDPIFLSDLAEAVSELNNNGHNLGIIFRRCPVDFSNRYDRVLNKYYDCIIPIMPIWKKNGLTWNTMMPTIDDMALQSNTIFHCEGVFNLGSSMVFDAVIHNKCCAFFNYNTTPSLDENWNVENIYNYIHFRSMPSKKAVLWIDNKSDLKGSIEKMISSPELTIEEAKKWFEIINILPANEASKRIWEHLNYIIK